MQVLWPEINIYICMYIYNICIYMDPKEPTILNFTAPFPKILRRRDPEKSTFSFAGFRALGLGFGV